jgi:hypothetical protein
MARSLLDIMRRAMLPLDGSIAEYVPAILAAYARLVPRRDWPGVHLVDLTSGSCLLALLAAGHGMRRLVVNDTASRSVLTASALFGRRPLDLRRVRRLVTTREPQLYRHTPTFHFASDYLTADVAATFDRLFHARLPAADRPAYRYLALRWALGFAASAEDAFTVLPTHDPRQLRDDVEHDWAPYLRRARRKVSVLLALACDINSAIAHLGSCRVDLHQTDMRDLCRRLDWQRRILAVVNPPTRGLDEYVVDDQLAHSLLANRWLPLSRSRETAERLWTSCVETALRHLPRGSHAVVWGGDGAMRWRDCRRVWERYGVLRAVGWASEPPKAGWAILEKT